MVTQREVDVLYFECRRARHPHLATAFPGRHARTDHERTMEEDGIAMAPDGHSFITSVGAEERTVWMHDPQGDHQISSEGYAHSASLSSDGARLFYMMARSGSDVDRGNELWVFDLHSGQASKALPGIAVVDYSLSRDGKRVVYEVRNDDGSHLLWSASLDHRFTPKELANGEGPKYTASRTSTFCARKAI